MKRPRTRIRLSTEPLESRRVLAALTGTPELTSVELTAGVSESNPIQLTLRQPEQLLQGTVRNLDLLTGLSVDVAQTQRSVFTLSPNNSISFSEVSAIGNSLTRSRQLPATDEITPDTILDSSIRVDAFSDSSIRAVNNIDDTSETIPQADLESRAIVESAVDWAQDPAPDTSLATYRLSESDSGVLSLRSALDYLSDSNAVTIGTGVWSNGTFGEFANQSGTAGQFDVGRVPSGLDVFGQTEVLDIDGIVQTQRFSSDDLASKQIPIGEASEVLTIGSSSIVDDPDSLPQIDSGTGNDSSSSASSVVVATVDIARNFAVSNLNQVSRRSTLPAQSPLVVSHEPTEPSLNDHGNSGDIGYSTSREHFSTHASVASLRRMEIIESTRPGIRLSSVRSFEAPLATTRSVVENEQILSRRTGAVRIDLPTLQYSGQRQIDDVGRVKEVEPREEVGKEPFQRTSMKMELDNPLVSISLLIFSCFGGMVVSRTLDPDDSQGSREISL